jgi:hypothetical protein
MPPSIFCTPVESRRIDRPNTMEEERGNHHDDTGSNDLECKIQAAGQMYQSIKAMRRQNELQQKKRLLRRRMRSLEDQNSWRKSLSLRSISVDSAVTPETHSMSARSTEVGGETMITHNGLLLDQKGDDPDQQGNDKESQGEVENEAVNASLLSEDSILSSEAANSGNDQELELLQLCEEQQDLLDRLVRHHQSEKCAWYQSHDMLRQERDILLKQRDKKVHHANSTKESRSHWETSVAKGDGEDNSSQAKDAVQHPPQTLEEPTPQIAVLQAEIKTLENQLMAKEVTHRQKMDEQLSKNQIATNALIVAMQRLETLQELATHLQSIVMESQKSRISNAK